ncbi:hypothetical protein CAPN004_23460 [Capnocytophaga cynodegmi]|uniref:Txe/YoeB family addiction module toxin n=1 Tax=Capnocytophaga cynodegmi TaxID=28189 RepID=UPI001AD15796|nr:Txe/YoeB family addiction module toxin [Capnocytophaga cynodegmi]GIM53317.1 hypothetical protein CAPN004_23460 [Capnocytophaga cynodegmi]
MAKYILEYSEEFIEHVDKHQLSGQKKICEKIDKLLDEIELHPTTGTGQIEPLKGYGEHSVWSRRIDKKHRLIYEVFEEEKRVEILSAFGHYDE